MRRVDDDVQPVEPVRQRGQQVRDVAVGAVGERRDAADVAAGGPLPLVAQRGLDAVLELVGQLVPAAREELDAVVGHRVVRRREHGAEVGVLLGREVGDGRGRQHAGVADVDAGRRQARPRVAAARNSPDARGSRPTTATGRWPLKAPTSARTWAAATERSSASSAVMSLFATPRTPSVPKSRATRVLPSGGVRPRVPGRRSARTTIPPEPRTGASAERRRGAKRLSRVSGRRRTNPREPDAVTVHHDVRERGEVRGDGARALVRHDPADAPVAIGSVQGRPGRGR